MKRGCCFASVAPSIGDDFREDGVSGHTHTHKLHTHAEPQLGLLLVRVVEKVCICMTTAGDLRFSLPRHYSGVIIIQLAG